MCSSEQPLDKTHLASVDLLESLQQLHDPRGDLRLVKTCASIRTRLEEGDGADPGRSQWGDLGGGEGSESGRAGSGSECGGEHLWRVVEGERMSEESCRVL